jgi:hypothetical protein
MEGFSFVTPVAGLNRPNTVKEDDDDDKEILLLGVVQVCKSVCSMHFYVSLFALDVMFF